MFHSLISGLPLLLVGIAFVLHIIGERRIARVRRRPRDRRARLRSASFYAGLLVVLGALAGPVDTEAARLFWVHMLQHVLLISVAAPLIVLGAPWMSIWRPLPLELRRELAGTIARAGWLAPLRWIAGALARPRGAWLGFSLSLVVWHIPGLYDLTLRYLAIHVLEHLMFLGFGILLWSQVIDSPPLRLRLSAIHRVYYMVAAAIPGWIISLVLAFAPTPLYPLYAHLANRPGGLSALADQQIAAGIMLVLGSLSTTVYVFIGLYRWLGADSTAVARRDERGRAPAGAGT